MNYSTFLIRISICFVLSILIGLERQYRHRMVGLRTNVLVSLGAFMFVIVSFDISSGDHSRIAAQVVSGIGFLGAGVILRDGSKIKGLNTAATLWCVAAIGVLTATGMIFEASIGTFFVLLSNIVLRILSMRIMNYVKKNNQELCTIKIVCKNDSETDIRRLLLKYLDDNLLNLTSLEKNEITKEEIKLNATILTTEPKKVENVVSLLSKNININNIKWSHFSYKDIDNEDVEEDAND